MANNNSTIALVAGAIIVVGIFGIVALKSNNGSGNTSQAVAVTAPIEGELEFSEMTWSFGEIQMKDGIATRSIEVTNPTPNPITITNMETSCMCTKTQIVRANGKKGPIRGMAGHGGSTSLSETIAPGENVVLNVDFDPNAHGPNGTGPITRSVTMETDSMDQKMATLRFSGNVVK